MEHQHEAVRCPHCGGTFAVDYAADPEVSVPSYVQVSCPECAAEVSVSLRRAALIFLARRHDARSMFAPDPPKRRARAGDDVTCLAS